MSKYNFTIIVERDEDGMFVAEVPDLKGCYTQGETFEEVLRNIREVIELCLETHKEIPNNEFIGIQRLEVSV